LPVKTLIPGAHAAATESPFVRLANTPARALDRKELQLFSHMYLPKTLDYRQVKTLSAGNARRESQNCGIKVSLIFAPYTRLINTIWLNDDADP